MLDDLLDGGRIAAVLVGQLACGCTGLKEGGTLPPFDFGGGVADVQSANYDAADTAGEAASEAATDASTDESMRSESGDGPSEASRDVDQSPLLDAVVPLNLRLWLTADKGITCSSGRVTKWDDQSGVGRDATLQLGQLGPQCQLMMAPHLINGIDVPYFSAPPNGNIVDETLDVDLSFLANSTYTLFVVERRWADPVSGTWPAEYLLGTSVPPGNEANPACAFLQQDATLAFGYINVPGGLNIGIDQGCDPIRVPVLATPTPPPAPVSQETAVFDSTLGHALWRDGASIWSDTSTVPLSRASDGAIGRAVLKTTASGYDQRFRGDIAEIMAYDAALGDAERRAVEGYLKGHWRY